MSAARTRMAEGEGRHTVQVSMYLIKQFWLRLIYAAGIAWRCRPSTPQLCDAAYSFQARLKRAATILAKLVWAPSYFHWSWIIGEVERASSIVCASPWSSRPPEWRARFRMSEQCPILVTIINYLVEWVKWGADGMINNFGQFLIESSDCCRKSVVVVLAPPVWIVVIAHGFAALHPSPSPPLRRQSGGDC